MRYMKDGELDVARIGMDVAIGIAVLALVLLCWPFYSVPTGSRGVITQFGKIVGIEGEGLAILPPWQKLSVFSIRSETADVENAEGSTNDTQPVHVSMTVRYSIATDKVAEVFEKYSHSGNLQSYVQTATQEIFKAVTAKYSAPDLIAQRAKVSTDIYGALQSKLDKYGAQVINIDMRNFSFSQSYMAAINEKVTQEQLRLGAENKLKTVEAEQKQKVAIATAEANAVKAKADGDAYATVQNATAQAKALQVQNDALARNRDMKLLTIAYLIGIASIFLLSVISVAIVFLKILHDRKEVLELRRIEVERIKAEKWDGALPVNMYSGAPILFFNAPQYSKRNPEQ